MISLGTNCGEEGEYFAVESDKHSHYLLLFVLSQERIVHFKSINKTNAKRKGNRENRKGKTFNSGKKRREREKQRTGFVACTAIYPTNI